MNTLKIITANKVYGEDKIQVEVKLPSELWNEDKEELARILLSTLPADRVLPLLDHANISTTQLDNYFKQLGYAPILKAQKVPELEVLIENGIYWNSSYNTFSPIKKDSYYDQALKHQGKFFVEVKFANQHPFAIARKNLEAKERKIKEEKAAKKREREIEKAKKLLAQND